MAVTQSFKAWLKASTNMKLSSDASVLRLTKEGITNFESLTDFDKKSMERLPATCKVAITAIALMLLIILEQRQPSLVPIYRQFQFIVSSLP